MYTLLSVNLKLFFSAGRNKKRRQKNMTTSPLTNSISLATAGRSFLLIPFVLVCLALSPMARAVLPAPDGGYASQNTAEGTDALFSLTIGANNLQLSPATRSAWTLGPGQQQLEPFSY